jgi:hypothetical protein
VCGTTVVYWTHKLDHAFFLPFTLFLTHLHSRYQVVKPKASGSAPRFEIKKWNAVAMWSWDICADTVRVAFRRIGSSLLQFLIRSLLLNACDYDPIGVTVIFSHRIRAFVRSLLVRHLSQFIERTLD